MERRPARMQAAEILGIGRFYGREVLLKGWLHNIRSSGGILFLQLRDGTGIIQCVAERSALGDEAFERAGALDRESSLEISGTVRADSRAPGGCELSISALRIVRSARQCPAAPAAGRGNIGTDSGHLSLRSDRRSAILRIRAGLAGHIRAFLDGRGFILCDAPILTPGSGGAAPSADHGPLLFECDYFGDRACLSGSARPYNEAAAAVFRKVYSFGPVFRAEGARAAGELTEFWMVEPEMAFAGLEDIMRLAEDLLADIAGRILESHGDLLAAVLERDLTALENVRPPFPRISYAGAVAALEEKGIGVGEGGRLGRRGEAALAAGHGRPLFVYGFPAAMRDYSVEPDPENPGLSLSFDLLAPEGYGGIIGGSQRIFDLELLTRRLVERRLPEKAFGLSLDLARCGGFPHSGFALGLERALAWICGAAHAGETIPFPRTIDRLDP